MNGTTQGGRTPGEPCAVAGSALIYLLPLLAVATAGSLLARELDDLPHAELRWLVSALGAALAGIAGAAVALACRREASRRRMERAFHLQALAQLHDAVVGVGPDFVIRAWNRAAERMYGYAAAEAIGRHVREILVTEMPDGGDIEDLAERVRHEPRVATVARRRRRDGSWFDAEVNVSQLRDESGRLVGYVGVHRDVTDITEARRIRERLHQAERLASIGTLAAGMAHEINNPLACVLSTLAFAQDEIARRPDLREAADALAEARAAAERMGHIVRELQAFAGLREEPERLDLVSAVKEALALVPEALGQRARIDLDLGPVPLVETSRRQLHRVLHHLLCNAFQAVPDHRAGRGEVRALTRTAPDGRAVVEIRDDGPGIPPEHLAHVFDPFFTTRQVGQGAGLGLAVCYGLVSAMAGELEVESALGKGTTFRVLLPAAGAKLKPGR